MGLHVEVLCDLRISGYAPGSVLNPVCWSDANRNPQGFTVAQAKNAARRNKWTLGPGTRDFTAVCPGCAVAGAAQSDAMLKAREQQP